MVPLAGAIELMEGGRYDNSFGLGDWNVNLPSFVNTMTARFAPYREASAGVQMILVSVHDSCGQTRPPTVTLAVVLPVDGRKLSPLMVMLIPLEVA